MNAAADILSGLLPALFAAGLLFWGDRRPGEAPLCILLLLGMGAAALYRLQIPHVPSLTQLWMAALGLP